jgi:hypothetical protein
VNCPKEFPSDENKEAFRSSRAQLKREVQRAKNHSKYKKLMKIVKTMKTRKRKAWARMRSLQAGHNLHHHMNQVINSAQDGKMESRRQQMTRRT